MRPSLAVTLTALILGSFGAVAGGAKPACAQQLLRVQSQFEWTPAPDGFGGISGLELSADGSDLRAVSDDGVFYSGRVQRDANGAVTGVDAVQTRPLVIEDGTRPDPKRHRDLEGLASTGDAGFYAVAENRHRILYYPDAHATPKKIKLPAISRQMPGNRGFEALAISSDGALVTLPEWSGGLTRPFPVYLKPRNAAWQHIYSLTRHADFRPVGADFGPDGHLYVLMRAFNGIGFAIRLERIFFENGTPTTDETLFVSKFRDFDNLEGLSIWTDSDDRLHMTAVSDDNFSRYQKTWLVDFVFKD